MPDETTPTPAPTPDASAPETPPAAATSEPKTFDETYVKELRSEAAKHRKEKQELAERLARFETEEKQKQERELVEQSKFKELADKYATELNALKQQLEAERLNNLRMRIGTELNVPSALLTRLQGANEDELRADAQALVEALGLNKPPVDAAPTPAPAPTPQGSKPNNSSTAITPGGLPAGKTDAQRQELMRRSAPSPIFGDGGGVTLIRRQTRL